MKVKFADSIHGTTTFRRVSVFEKPQAPEQPTERKIPPGVASLLRQHGVDWVPGAKFTVGQLDEHFKQRGTRLVDRMRVKSCLAQIGAI